MSSSIRRAVLVFAILITALLALSDCVTLHPHYVLTTDDCYVQPHNLQQMKGLLQELIHQERAAGYHVELGITVHCYQNTEQWYCTWMGGFLEHQFDRLAPVRLYWSTVPMESPDGDPEFVYWNITVVSSD